MVKNKSFTKPVALCFNNYVQFTCNLTSSKYMDKPDNNVCILLELVPGFGWAYFLAKLVSRQTQKS